MTKNVGNDEVDNSKGKDTNNETDNAIEDGVFGFFDFASITRRGHVGDATDDDNNNTDEAEDADNSVENGNDITLKVVVIGFIDRLYFGDTKFCDNIFHV